MIGVKEIKKVPLKKRKWIVFFVGAFIGIVLFSYQIKLTAQKLEEKGGEMSPFYGKEDVFMQTRGARDDVKKMFSAARKEMDEALEVSKEDVIKILLKEGVINEDDVVDIKKEDIVDLIKEEKKK